jgi:ketosteroid isomerase-like protein
VSARIDLWNACLVNFEDIAELVRRSYAAFNRQDLEEVVSLYERDCEWDMSHFSGWPETQVYRGHEGLKELFRFWYGAWEEFHVEPAEILPAGSDRTFMRCELSVKGEGSGVPLEMTFWQVGEARNGKVLRVVNYTDLDEAKEAAGLSEQDAHADS